MKMLRNVLRIEILILRLGEYKISVIEFLVKILINKKALIFITMYLRKVLKLFEYF